MITTAIANFSPVTESDVDPYGDLFWTGEMSENLSMKWTSFVTEILYEHGEKSAYVNPATGEVIAHIDGAWMAWDEQDWDEIREEIAYFEYDLN